MAFVRRIFRTYPLVSNCVIYGTLYVTAEFTQQTVLRKYLRPASEPPLPYDTQTMKNYAVIATFGMSPTLYYWYKFLDRKFVGTAAKTVIRKCLMDQFMMTPNILAIFYVGMSVLEGREDKFAELKDKFVPTFIANSCFWMPIQAMNFALIPPQFRVVYIGFCSLIWANILCMFKRNDKDEEGSDTLKSD